MRKIIFFSISVMIITIIISIFLSLKEKYIEMQITKLNKKIYGNYYELQNLKAEWGYLNNKEYLNMLVKKYLPELRVIKNINNNEDFIKKLP